MKRSAIKRGKPLQRGQPLARGRALKAGKPMQRGAKLKSRKVPRAFRQRRDPQYCDWVRQRPCLCWHREWWRDGVLFNRHQCSEPVEVTHVRSRGAGGDDRGNVVPLCGTLHRQQHAIGRLSFERLWSLDLRAEAELLYAAYQRETGAP